MLWMETIRLRSGNSAQSQVLTLIGTFEKEMRKSKTLVNWQVYRHATISGDFFILLQWDTDRVAAEASLLAYNLINMLSSEGVVDHSVWITPTHLYED